MKVIGTVKNGVYLCEVSHSEIEKHLDLYYNDMKELKVGQEVDLGAGYLWYQKTKDALKSTESFFKSNIKNIDAITKAFTLTCKEDS